MDLVIKRDQLESRAFVIQFFEIMSEFGHIIPWLEYLKTIQYSTNPIYFRDKLLQNLKCEDEGDIVPYQLIKEDESGEMLGSILHFRKSPERFIDYRNIELTEQLDADGYEYLTCLQLRSAFRKKGIGHQFLTEIINVILGKHRNVWAVVSNYNAHLYYNLLGAQVVSPKDNLDKAWIIKWST